MGLTTADYDKKSKQIAQLESANTSKVAAASANTATAPGAAYVQAEAAAVLTELRDLKTKLRNAGLLLP